jgi:hypothetical protein
MKRVLTSQIYVRNISVRTEREIFSSLHLPGTEGVEDVLLGNANETAVTGF